MPGPDRETTDLFVDLGKVFGRERGASADEPVM